MNVVFVTDWGREDVDVGQLKTCRGYDVDHRRFASNDTNFRLVFKRSGAGETRDPSHARNSEL